MQCSANTALNYRPHQLISQLYQSVNHTEAQAGSGIHATPTVACISLLLRFLALRGISWLSSAPTFIRSHSLSPAPASRNSMCFGSHHNHSLLNLNILAPSPSVTYVPKLPDPEGLRITQEARTSLSSSESSMNITTCMRFTSNPPSLNLIRTHAHRPKAKLSAFFFTFSVAAARLMTFVFAASSCLGATLDLELVSFWGSAFSFSSSTLGFGSVATCFAGHTKGAGCLPSAYSSFSNLCSAVVQIPLLHKCPILQELNKQ